MSDPTPEFPHSDQVTAEPTGQALPDEPPAAQVPSGTGEPPAGSETPAGPAPWPGDGQPVAHPPRAAYPPAGYGQPAGYPFPGPTPAGYGQPTGYGPPGYATAGYAPPGYAPAGYGPPGYGPTSGYGPPPGFAPPTAGYGPPVPGYGPAGPVPVPYAFPAPQMQTAPSPGGKATSVVIAQLPGTSFGLALPQIPPVTYGPAIGSMLAGIGSILVAFVVLCFGLSGANAGWGPLVSGAFAILAALLGAAAIASGRTSRRTIRRSDGTLVGSGTAMTGFVCGIVGAAITLVSFGLSLLATYS